MQQRRGEYRGGGPVQLHGEWPQRWPAPQKQGCVSGGFPLICRYVEMFSPPAQDFVECPHDYLKCVCLSFCLSLSLSPSLSLSNCLFSWPWAPGSGCTPWLSAAGWRCCWPCSFPGMYWCWSRWVCMWPWRWETKEEKVRSPASITGKPPQYICSCSCVQNKVNDVTHRGKFGINKW